MSEIDIAGATEALEESLPADYNSGEVEAPTPDATSEDNQETPESFTGFDPGTLPDDLQAVYKSMQADYTRKTQELSEIRGGYTAFSESGVDPSEALNVVNLWQQMQTDPEVGAQVIAALQERFQENGQTQSEPSTTTSNTNYEGLSPEIAGELSAMRDFREQYVAEQDQARLVSELEGEEQQIRVANPQYSDDDVEAIYSLAYSTGGDLNAAATQYHGIQQRLLGGYLTSKQAPFGVTPAPPGGSSAPPRAFANLDEAHKAAMEAIRNSS